MNFISVLSCLILVLAAVAQNPKPCVSPPLLNGGVTLMASNGVIATGTISYDAFGQRIRYRNFVTAGNQTTYLDQLMLFHQKVYYEINWSTFSCQKRPLDISFIPMQIPSDAKLMGPIFLGSSSSWGTGLLVNNWYGDLPFNGSYITTFTEIGCIPLFLNSYTPPFGWFLVSTFNWVIGNTNPMDYNPPFFCANATLENVAPVNMFAALESLAMKTMTAK